MAFPKQLMLAVHRAASYFVYGSTAEAAWIYEKVQRPKTLFTVALNVLYWKLRQPRVRGIVALLLEPVFDCNLRCTYCPWTLVRPRLEGIRPRLMSWDTFCAAVDSAPDSIETVQLAGLGEPTMHPQISEMVDRIAERGKRTILFSNCTLLKDDLLERLAETRLSVLTVSAEPDEDTCRTFRGVDLKTIRGNVEAFRARKQPMTEVKLRIVAHSGNLDRIAMLRDAWGDIFDDVKVCPEFRIEGHGRQFVCMEPWRGNINVWTDGKVTPCCLDCFEDFIIGDISELPLTDIIRGDRYRDLLTRFVKGGVPPRCATCSDVVLDGLPSLLPRSSTGGKPSASAAGPEEGRPR
ncbi:MAG TPA: radical SAM protein [Candidatus Hydrogenedentes bacterium]|nr:radical SAM protein [Candidatus Hydrogenedentota bacterium]HPG65741.1 radical SAM protein [Candidatus Hydrogenedentota bacterium]